jgi:putative hemolysin
MREFAVQTGTMPAQKTTKEPPKITYPVHPKTHHAWLARRDRWTVRQRRNQARLDDARVLAFHLLKSVSSARVAKEEKANDE